MKNAEEIISEILKVDGDYTAEGIIHAINEARIEAIRECARVAKTTWDKGHIYIESAYVDKKAILDLINQVK